MVQTPTSERSLWRSYYTTSRYPKLVDDIEVDVAIVGGGITGLTSAYLLKQAGMRIAVLEKDTVGGGTTGRTTGKVSSQHNLTYYDMVQQLGTPTAQAYADANQAAVEKVAEIIAKENIACDWAIDDNYVFTADDQHVPRIKREAETAASLGLPSTYVTESPLPFEIKGAMKFTDQGKFNSQKYLLGLARSIDGNGSYVFEHTNVTGIRDGSPARVRSASGSVTAKDVIVATSVPTLPLAARGGYCALEYPTESFIVAGELGQGITGMYISPDSNHYSILPITVDERRMILIGGEGGHLPGLSKNTEQKFQRLAEYANKHFNVGLVTHQWSDRDYTAYDNLPIIGKLYRWSKHLYVGSAYRKWGLSNGTVAAMVLSDTILGNQNQWTKVFDSTRLQPVKYIPRAALEYVKQNLG